MKTGILTIAAGFGLLLVAFFAMRVLSYQSPTVDVLGSYFPAWMVCILSGLALTLIARWIVQFRNLKAYLGPAPLIYSCLMI
ncbi:MAG: YtcA family, partial [Verrucomicrobiota bacterium]